MKRLATLVKISSILSTIFECTIKIIFLRYLIHGSKWIWVMTQFGELPLIAPKAYQDGMDQRQLNQSSLYQPTTTAQYGLESAAFSIFRSDYRLGFPFPIIFIIVQLHWILKSISS